LNFNLASAMRRVYGNLDFFAAAVAHERVDFAHALAAYIVST
jgi:hypothetical protein